MLSTIRTKGKKNKHTINHFNVHLLLPSETHIKPQAKQKKMEKKNKYKHKKDQELFPFYNKNKNKKEFAFSFLYHFPYRTLRDRELSFHRQYVNE